MSRRLNSTASAGDGSLSRSLLLLMVWFVVGGLASVGVLYHSAHQVRFDDNARDLTDRLLRSIRIIHSICDRSALNDSDRGRLPDLIASTDDLLAGLTGGGTVDGLRIAPSDQDARDRVAVVEKTWMRTRSAIEGVLVSPPTDEPATRFLAHPEVGHMEAATGELMDWRLEHNARRQDRYFLVVLGVLAANVLLLTMAIHRVRRRVIEPVRSLAHGAERIRLGDFDHIVPVRSDDELGSLARAFNEMGAEVARLLNESRAAANQLRRSEERLRRAQAISHTGNWECRIPTGEMYWSDEVYRIFGLEPQKSPPDGSRFWAAVHTEDLPAVQAASAAAIRDGTAYCIDHRVVRPDGAVRFVRERGEVVRDNGVTTALEGTVQDITDYQKLEEQFLHAQKMQAVGRLAGGVAHDFNNLLTVILGSTGMALDALRDNRPARRYLDTVLASGQRASALTAKLLAFSRKQVLQPVVVDVNELIAGLTPIVRQLVSAQVDLGIQPRATRPFVKADPTQLEQVLLNLAANARDAMPDGGVLLVETRNVHLEADEAARKQELAPGPYVLVTVTDNGEGMDAETLAQAFDPFFTTKEVGRGTGLGLATVYGIVRQSGGDVAAYSEPGHGTTVRVYLPEVGGEREDVAEAPGSRRVQEGGGTLLVTEDEPAVRALAVEALRGAGYRVLEAANAAEASDVAGEHSGPIDLLVTDVIMPGELGPALAGRLAAARPDLRVLYMSGYAEGALERSGGLKGAGFLQKPFTPSALKAAVRETLER